MKTKLTNHLHPHFKHIQTHTPHTPPTENIIINIPLPHLTPNTLLPNLPPKIPLPFNLIPHPFTHLKTKINPYPINNPLIHITIFLQIKLNLI
ncbi:sporulation protein YunB, partial [Bacillus subtilis]|uniref:sporulation protein YunB n=1 Tax=Bacillus subtilis TaxID=1423 RepID=UPI00338F16BA